jgi:hypothetical protein
MHKLAPLSQPVNLAAFETRHWMAGISCAVRKVEIHEARALEQISASWRLGGW